MTKYLSSVLFILATSVLAYHEALSTVSKHGTVDLISGWPWHISQWLIVLLFTVSGGLLINQCISFVCVRTDYGVPYWKKAISFRSFGQFVWSGLAPALILYQFLYHWLCGVVK